MVDHAQGTLVWIKHEDEVWKAAEIISGSGSEVIVKSNDSDEQIHIKPSDPIYLRNVDQFSSEGLTVLDDLTQLTHLHEPAVLHSLQMRFDIDKIYTFTGPILIAVNPFKVLPGVYCPERLRSFITPKPSSVPHVFSTANAAFRGVCDHHTCQTVLISGESGAGKTETTKFVMKFLAMAGAGDDGTMTPVEKQVLESNPLLEAFGNARTLRNDNSSRFGKFIELQFTSTSVGSPSALLRKKEGISGDRSRLCGARIQTYLLEKVRVTDQQEGERNFHAFYQACAAFAAGGEAYQFPQVITLAKDSHVKPFEISMKGFAKHDAFQYLSRSTCSQLAGCNDQEQFEFTVNAMATIGIPVSEIESIFGIISAVLHVGNTVFCAPPGNSEGSMVSDKQGSFSVVAQALGVSVDALEGSMCHKTIVTRSERMKSSNTLKAACDTRDSLACALYSLVFRHIVSCTNTSIGYRPDVSLFIGVLDIFGFECFKVNSFEQLCINFTNERLQQFFNTFVFKLEEALYTAEKIPWDPLDFPDNQDAVDLLQDKPLGIFAMLDEECLVPQGSDKGFCSKLWKQHIQHKRFGVIKTKPTWFVINHFAGPVQYSSDFFLDKNKDHLSTDVVDLMLQESSNPFVKRLFEERQKALNLDVPSKVDGPRKKQKIVTVSSEFKEQLSMLMDMITKTEPHFIRCIKPNPQNLPDVYDRPSVTEQLRYGGVLQAVQVSRAGYPVRIDHTECFLDYRILVDKALQKKITPMAPRERVVQMLEKLSEMGVILAPQPGSIYWAVGVNLVFFKQESFEKLQQARLTLRASAAVVVQAKWRMMRQRIFYKGVLVCTIHIQALIRGKIARLRAAALRREQAAVRIQAFMRRSIVRMQYIRSLRGIVLIQSVWRGIIGRRDAAHFKRFQAAAKIQAAYRRLVQERRWKALRIAVRAAQQKWRSHAAKQQLRRLKQEAREVGALLSKQQHLSIQVKESQKALESETATRLKLESEKKALVEKVKHLEETIEQLREDIRNKEWQHEEELKSMAARVAGMEEANAANAAIVAAAKVKAVPAPKLAAKAAQKRTSRVDAPKIDRRDSRDEEIERRSTSLVEKSGVSIVEKELMESQLREKDRLLEQKDEETTKLKEELAALQAESVKLKRETMQSDALYQQLLKNSSFQSMGTIGPIAPPPQPSSPTSRMVSNRIVDIELVGAEGVGKSVMLENFIKKVNPQNAHKIAEGKKSMMSHYRIQTGDKTLKVLDASGNIRAAHLVREWFHKSNFVLVVYDVCDIKTFERAVEIVKEVVAANAHLILFGNKYRMEVQNCPPQVNISAAKDLATRNGGYAIESVHLNDAINCALSIQDQEHETRQPQEPGKQSAISTAIDSVKNWFGNGKDMRYRSSSGVLKPSLKGTRTMKAERNEADGNNLRAVQELQDTESAVTCICFGQEQLHRNYILLAAASKDGTVVVYRCYRTEMEINMLAQQNVDLPPDSGGMSTDQTTISVHSRLMGHSRAITSIFFNLLEDQLVTTSIDKSVRFWQVDGGEMLKVFTDSSPVPVAAFLPFNPQVFVAANSNAVLRLVNVQNGTVLQKLKVETEVRALKFDDTGLFLLAGTKNGSIHVLEASDSKTLKFKFKVQLARSGVTCITFVPAQEHGAPPCLLVNTSDSSVTIIDVTYGPPKGVLTNLTVKHRVKVAHSLLPLKCCYSPSGSGFLISGSEDKQIYIYSLAKGQNYKSSSLKHHNVPVVAVATNLQDTLLASADSLGKIVLWRRMDFSHLKDKEMS